MSSEGRTRTLAIDYGSKRIGLSVSDPLGLTAQPLPYVANSGSKKFLCDLKAIIAERSVGRVILGWPRSLDDSSGPAARQCENLAAEIKRECGVPVVLYDERFTTRDAEEILIREFDMSRKKRKEVRDSLAACLMLRSYLDSNPGA